jgi:hypothetical protein
MKKRAVLDNFSKALEGPATKAPVAKDNRHDLGYDSDESAAVPPMLRMLQFSNILKTVNIDSEFDVYFSEFQKSIKNLSKATPVLKDYGSINVTKKNGDIKRVIGFEREGVAIKVDKGAVSFHKRNSKGAFQETEPTEEVMAVFAALYGVSEDYKSRVDNLTANAKDAGVKDSVVEEKKSLNSSDGIDPDNQQVDNADDSFIAKKNSPSKETSTATLETEQDSGQLSDNQSFVQGIGTPDIVSKMGDSEDGLDFSIDLSYVSRNQRRKGVKYVSSQRRGMESDNEEDISLKIFYKKQTSSRDREDSHVTNSGGSNSVRRFSEESYEESDVEEISRVESSDLDDERLGSPVLDIIQSPVKPRDSVVKDDGSDSQHRKVNESDGEDLGSLEISKEGQTSFDNQQSDFADESSILSGLEGSDLRNTSRDEEDIHVTNNRGNKGLRRFSEESYEESAFDKAKSLDFDDERFSPVLDLKQSPVKSRDFVVKDGNSEDFSDIQNVLIQDEVKTPLVEGSKKSDSRRSSSNSYEDSFKEDVNQSRTPLKKRGDKDSSQSLNPFSSIIQSSNLADIEGQSNVDQSIFSEQSQESDTKTPVESDDELDFSNVSMRRRTPTPKRDRKEQQHSPLRDVSRSPFADIVGESKDNKSESSVSFHKETEVVGHKLDNRAASLVTSEDDKKGVSTKTPVRVDKKETPKEADNKPESSRRGIFGKVATFKSLFTGKKDRSKGVVGNVKVDKPQEYSNLFAASNSSIDRKEDNRDEELSFPPSSSAASRKPVQSRGIAKNLGISANPPKEESTTTNRIGKSSSSGIDLEGVVGGVDDFLMKKKNAQVTTRNAQIDGQGENPFSPICFSPERSEASSRKLDSGESNKTPVSIKSQSNTETISPKKSVIPRKSKPYRGASLSPSTSISDADVAMKTQAGVMPQIIECGSAGVWWDTNFIFLYENRESKTKEEVKGVAFNSLVAIIDKVTLDFQKNEKYDNMHLKMEEVIALIDYSREIGGVYNKLNEKRTGYVKNVGIEEWKVKFSASFQKYCGERGFHTDKDCNVPLKLTRLPPEVYDILKDRDPEFEPIKHERNVRLSFSGVDLSPKTRKSLSPQNILTK